MQVGARPGLPSPAVAEQQAGGLRRGVAHAAAPPRPGRARRWVQGECRGLSDADSPDLEVNPLLRRAADALRERPVLFGYCAEEVATARHTALFQRFIKASCVGERARRPGAGAGGCLTQLA